MDVVKQVDPAIEQIIAGLFTEFCRRVDQGQGDRVAELFTPDGTIAAPHFALSGRDEIHAWYAKRAAPGARVTLHLWSNLRVTPLDDGYAAEANTLVLAGEPPAPSPGARIAAGRSTDRVVLVDGRPLFAARSLEIRFEGIVSVPENAA